jgi:hypothetical protein
MYRDASSRVDEHDRAVGAVLIAEAILGGCDQAVARLAAPNGNPTDRWRAVMELHDNYPEVWRHMDRARAELARRGSNTMAFDELRPHAPRTVVKELKANVRAADTVVDGSAVDRVALDAARRGIEVLKLALPGADWSDIGARTDAVGQTVLARHGRPRLIAGIGAVLAAGVIMCGFAATQQASARPRTPSEAAAARADELARSLADIQDTRRADIDVLQRAMTPMVCEAKTAHALIRLLVLDGRHADARVFGDRYVAQCGDDAFIDTWAAAPQPHRRETGLQFVGYVHFHDGDKALMVDPTGAGHIVDIASVDHDPMSIEARGPADK